MMSEQPEADAGEVAPLTMTDEELLADARRGDHGAFHRLIDRHADGLFRLAFRLVGSTADAEDVLQEAFVGAFEQMGRFEGRSTVKTWLSRILVRQTARFHRRRSRRRTLPLPLAGDGGDEPDVRGSTSVSDDANRRLDVDRALRQLSPEHREVVVLREFGGMSYSEMGEALGIPVGTVESRLHRARQALKEALSDYLP